ncbi:MAG: lipopolysaccharide biosynthesis protein, partial [Pseudomonadota bacterium]
NRDRAETGDNNEALTKAESISVIEQAVPPEEPSSPNRPRLAIAGLGAGMMMGLGLIVLLELLNSAIRRPQDIVQRLEITPLGTLPFIRTRADRIRRRLTLLVVLAGVGGTVFGALWGIDTYVMPLDLLLEAILERLPQIDFTIPSQDG